MNIDLTPPILLFDGTCNLCNNMVQFIIRNDHTAQFRFASLQSDIGRELLQLYGLPLEHLQSVVLVFDNRAYTESEAALHTARLIGGIWGYAYWLHVLPLSSRNMLYRWVARNRYRWFGQQAQCMVPSPELQKRFL